MVEEVVAGIAQGVGAVDLTVGVAAGGPGQTGGEEALVLGVHALIHDLLAGQKNVSAQLAGVVLHGGDQGTHLEGGSGRILSAEGPVEHGVLLVRHDIGPVLVHGSQVIRRIAGAGQDVAGLDLHDDDSGALGVQTRMFTHFGVVLGVGDPTHDGLQRILRGLLDIDIQGSLHVIAGDGVLGVVGIGGCALSVNLVIAGAVDAVEVAFKSLLEAGLTHLGVHGVALFLVLGPVGIVHAAQIAQNVGSVLGVVFPDGGSLNDEAGGIQLQQSRQLLVGNVLQEGVGRQVGDTAQVEFVPEADDRTGILVGPVIGQTVPGAHPLHQQGGGDVGVQADVRHEQLEVVLPGGGQIRQGILKRTGPGDGEMVGIFNAQLLALLHQVVKSLVTLGIGLDNVVVKNQVVRSAVAHQHIAVAVQNIASGGTDGGNGTVDLGIVGVAVSLDDLQHEQTSGEQNQNEGKQNQKQNGPEAAYSFHVLPPIRPIL